MTISSKTPKGLTPMTPEEVEAAAYSDADARPLSSAELQGMRRSPQSKIIRRVLGLTPEQFSRQYQIPLVKLLEWEAGRSEPDQTERSYLREIARQVGSEEMRTRREKTRPLTADVKQFLNGVGIELLREISPHISATAQALKWLGDLIVPELPQAAPSTRSIAPAGDGARSDVTAGVDRQIAVTKSDVIALLLETGISVIPVRISSLEKDSSLLTLHFVYQWPADPFSTEILLNQRAVTPAKMIEHRGERLLDIALPVRVADVRSCSVALTDGVLKVILDSAPA
jgi:DNA-binding transcriptional regulator YiaG